MGHTWRVPTMEHDHVTAEEVGQVCEVCFAWWNEIEEREGPCVRHTETQAREAGESQRRVFRL